MFGSIELFGNTLSCLWSIEKQMWKKVMAVALLAVLAGCSTPEFRAERGQCTAQWNQKIPPVFVRELFNRIETRQVPTGRIICETSGTVTICDQQMRKETFKVPDVRTVDRNKPRRDAQISACTRQSCLEKFGNASCEL